MTPDSFTEFGRFEDSEIAAEHALKLLEEGADIIDIGGESTRPGSESVPKDVQLTRVQRTIEKIRQHAPNTIISLDTSIPELVEDLDVDILNYTSSDDLNNPVHIPTVFMHTRGNSKTMSTLTDY